MINGKASKSGGGLRITMTLLDVYEAKAIARDAREMALGAIENDVPGMAKKLFNSILRRRAVRSLSAATRSAPRFTSTVTW